MVAHARKMVIALRIRRNARVWSQRSTRLSGVRTFKRTWSKLRL